MASDPPERRPAIDEGETPTWIYSNTAFVRSGGMDLVIDFGHKDPLSNEDILDVRVAMSWEHAKTLSKLLSTSVESFEKNIGPIPDVSPDRFVKLLEELAGKREDGEK